MILREVVLHNFGPYRGRTVIDLSPRSSTKARPVVLIGGLNGGGKTTLLDGIQLALYGARARCSTRKGVAYTDFLRASINGKVSPTDGASVSVEFDFATSRGTSRLRVVRSWHATKKGIAEDSRVYRGEVEDAELSETWSERVEQLLPLGISNLFFFDGEQVRELASSSEATDDVRTAIRTLLGLELPQQLQEDLGLIVSRRRKAMVQAPSSREGLQRIEQLRRDNHAKQEGGRARVAELNNSMASIRRHLDATKGTFAATGGELARIRPELERQVAAAEARQKQGRERLREIAAGSIMLGLVRDLLVRSASRADVELAHRDNHKLVQTLKRRDAEILRLARKGGAHDALVDELRTYLNKDVKERSQGLNTPPYLCATGDAPRIAMAALSEARSIAHPQAKAAIDEIRSAEDQATRAEAQLAAAATQEDLGRQLDTLHAVQGEVAQVQRDFDVAQADLAALVAEGERLRGEYDRHLRELTQVEAEAEEDTRVIRSAERVSTLMDEFKRRMLARKVHELERATAERFSHLARKQNFIQRVMINPDSFELSLFDSDGSPVVRDRMSAGEQQLLAVAFLWALALTSGRNLPVVIDTPLGRMDHSHRRSLVERYFAHASHQVVLLSTDAEIDEQYRRVLHDVGAIDREYTIRFDPDQRQSEVVPGYFWS